VQTPCTTGKNSENVFFLVRLCQTFWGANSKKKGRSNYWEASRGNQNRKDQSLNRKVFAKDSYGTLGEGTEGFAGYLGKVKGH